MSTVMQTEQLPKEVRRFRALAQRLEQSGARISFPHEQARHAPTVFVRLPYDADVINRVRDTVFSTRDARLKRGNHNRPQGFELHGSELRALVNSLVELGKMDRPSH